ncbi:HK97 gp10 family phage protein [Lysinibacillus sp. LZ02]|uniref:HK97 gp10 family phage protein n=1 Tax=Lysinibacillus sp. LZ02 TaxID=3420668 RepID=UPI003D35ED6E
MARRGARVDYRQLQRMQRKIQRLGQDYEKFLESMTKEIAARLLRRVKNNTKVITGTLRNNWTVDANVKKVGNQYQIEVFNPTEYAMYYEYGHRTRDHQGWVNGRFTMTIAADQIERQAPSIIEKKLTRMLREAFDGN